MPYPVPLEQQLVKTIADLQRRVKLLEVNANNPVAVGGVLAQNSLQSPNYSTVQPTGWQLSSSGAAVLQNVTIVAQPTASNQLSGDDSTMSSSVGGWSAAYNCVIAQGLAPDGLTPSMIITAAGSPLAIVDNNLYGAVPVNPGDTVTVTSNWWGTASGRTVIQSVLFADANGNSVSTGSQGLTGASHAISNGSYGTVSDVFTAPAGATQITALGAVVTGAAANELIYNTSWTIIDPDTGAPLGAILLYTGTPALGNLAMVISSEVGSDSYGNSWGPGFNSANAFGGSAVVNAGVIGLFSGVNQIIELTNAGLFIYSPYGALNNLIGTWTSASGTDSYGNAYPKGLSPAALILQDTAIPALPAGGIALFANTNGTSLQSLSGSGMTGDVPGIETDSSVHVASTTGFTGVTKAWPIPANDGQTQTIYRLICGGWGQQATTTSSAPTVTVKAFGAQFNTIILPASLITSGTQFYWRAVTELMVATTGSSGTARATTQFTWSGVSSVSSANQTMAASQTSDTTIDTTSATTMQFQTEWSTVTNSPSMTGNYSILERIGP